MGWRKTRATAERELMRPFAAAVLTGGSSTRMGGDKALIEVNGIALARRVAEVALAAGADRVVCVGGDEPALRSLGLATVSDGYPGEGPLGALLTAFATLDASTIVALSCDLPDLDVATITAVLTQLDDHAVALAMTDRWHPLVAAYDRARCEGPFAAVFASGGRALHTAIRLVDVVTVRIPEPSRVRNVNYPADLR